MTLSYTEHFRFAIPDFETEPWHAEWTALVRHIDQVLFSALYAGITIWANSIDYEQYDLVVSPDDGTFWICDVAHTSAASPTTFAADRVANPTFWIQVSATGGGGGLNNVVEDLTPQLGGNLDTNGFNIDFDDGFGIRDSSANELLLFDGTATAVNHFVIGNADTGSYPSLVSDGSDTNVGQVFTVKGTADVLFTARSIAPTTNDAASLGTSTLKWSDAFFASGAVVNFNAGDYTLTHSAGLLTASGPFSLGTANALTAGTIELGHATDTTIDRAIAGGDIRVEGNIVYRAGGTDVALADGGTGTSLADPGADRIMAWDDSAGVVKFMAIADFTLEAAPASGDKVLIYGAEGDLRQADWSTLPTYSDEQAQDAVGGILTDNLVIDFTYDDATPQITATIVAGGVSNTMLASMAASTFKVNLTGGAAAPTNAGLSDFTEDLLPAAGDFVIGFEAGGGIRKFDIGNFPGAGGGISNVVEDTTPQLGGDLDANGFDILFDDLTGIRDSADNEMLIFDMPVLAAVNYFQMANAVTATQVILSAVGDDTDVSMQLDAKGAGSLLFSTGGTQRVAITAAATIPGTDDGNALGTASSRWSDLFLASGAVIDFANNNARVTHTSGILTVTTGDLRVTTAGTNTASVVTVGGTQTLTSKSLTSPTITGSPTAAGATWADLGTVTTIDVNGGTIDGTTIGGASAAAGTFTNLIATGFGVFGHTAQLSIGGNSDGLERFGTTAATGGMALGMFNATAGTGPHFDFYRSKNAAIGSATVVASGDNLGSINWFGAQQTGTFATQTMAAQIRAEVDGTVTSGAGGDMPGRLVFATTADAGSAVTDRLILDNVGTLKPNANDGVALGTGTLAFSDLFLASGAVINFNAGNYTITHSAGLLTTNGNLSLTTSGVLTTGTIELGAASDTTLARVSAGVISVEGVTLLTTATGQPLDATLTALAAYNTNGLLTQTAADTFVGRTITGTANEVEVTDGNGVAGNPTIGLPNDVVIATSLTLANTGLHLLDTDATHDLIIKPGSNLSADRTLTITTGNTDMIVDFTAVTDEFVLAYDTGTNTWRGVASSGGTPTLITVANEATDTTCFPAFFTAATGDLGPKTNANLTYNSNTGAFSIGTAAALTTGTIELGAASDTTLARSGAGDVSIEGNVIYRAGGTDVALADGGTGTSLADPNIDRLMGWDDSAGVVKFLALTDINTELTPASGDFLVIYDAAGNLLKTDWANLPGAGGGISNVVEDTTPQLGGDLDANTFNILFDDNTGIDDQNGNAILYFQTVASADNYLEVHNAPNGVSFTNDAPRIAAVGAATDVGLILQTKGSEGLVVQGFWMGVQCSGGAGEIYFDRTDTHGDGATLGTLDWFGRDSGAVAQTYSRIFGTAVSDNAGAEIGGLEFYTVSSAAVTKRLTIDTVIKPDVAFSEKVVALTDGATPALDASLGNIFTLSAAGNRTIAVPSGGTVGQKIIIAHTASGGARTLALNTGAGGFRFGTTITALTSTPSGQTDHIGCIFNLDGDGFWDVVAYNKGA